jgi:hypothetical protein
MILFVALLVGALLYLLIREAYSALKRARWDEPQMVAIV